MPNIITATQLRDVLGVSDSLFNDAYLNSIIESAEQSILPLLTAYQSAVTSYRVKLGKIIFTTQRPNFMVKDQSVVITGCGSVNGTYTINDYNSTFYEIAADTANPDLTIQPIIPAGKATIAAAITLYAGVPAVENALLNVSNEIFQSITAAGGQIEGVDFARLLRLECQKHFTQRFQPYFLNTQM